MFKAMLTLQRDAARAAGEDADKLAQAAQLQEQAAGLQAQAAGLQAQAHQRQSASQAALVAQLERFMERMQ